MHTQLHLTARVHPLLQGIGKHLRVAWNHNSGESGIIEKVNRAKASMRMRRRELGRSMVKPKESASFAKEVQSTRWELHGRDRDERPQSVMKAPWTMVENKEISSSKHLQSLSKRVATVTVQVLGYELGNKALADTRYSKL